MQTHGQYEEIWRPPESNSPFIQYTRSDEFWMRPFGLGRIEQRLLPLYDVRFFDQSLVGYCEMNPCDHYGGSIRVQYCPPVTPAFFGQSAKASHLPFETIHLRTRWICIGSEEYVFWQVENASDATNLLDSKQIKAIGVDNLREFCYQLQMKDRMRQFSYAPCGVDSRSLIRGAM